MYIVSLDVIPNYQNSNNMKSKTKLLPFEKLIIKLDRVNKFIKTMGYNEKICLSVCLKYKKDLENKIKVEQKAQFKQLKKSKNVSRKTRT